MLAFLTPPLFYELKIFNCSGTDIEDITFLKFGICATNSFWGNPGAAKKTLRKVFSITPKMPKTKVWNLVCLVPRSGLTGIASQIANQNEINCD